MPSEQGLTFPRADIPNSDQAIVATRGNQPAIGREGHHLNPGALQRSHGSVLGKVPKYYAIVSGGGGKGRPVC